MKHLFYILDITHFFLARERYNASAKPRIDSLKTAERSGGILKQIDEYFGYSEGKLEYHTVDFETEVHDCCNYQGNAVVNYTERAVPYTRIIEHKYFETFGGAVYKCPKTVISKEYSSEWKDGMEPYYPVNDNANAVLYARYWNMAQLHLT